MGRAQLIEHDPGPRGSPHVPHGPGALARGPLDADAACAANTENRLSSSRLWQAGHSGTV